MRPSTTVAEFPPAQSLLQGLAFEALGDAQDLADDVLSDPDAVAVACTQAVVMQLADIANELRAWRERTDRAVETAFGDGDSTDLEDELHPNGGGYRSAGS